MITVILKKREKFTLTVSVLLFLSSALVLLGWQFDLPTLKSGFHTFVSVKPNCALGFMALAVSLYLYSRFVTTVKERFFILAFASFAGFIGIATIWEYFTLHDLGIDEVLYTDSNPAPGLPAGRMSLTAAVSFTLISLAIFLSVSRKLNYVRISQLLSLGVLILALQTFFGHLVGLEESHTSFFLSKMAVLTSVLFILTTLGLLNLQRHTGIIQMLCTDGVAGRTARRLIFYVLCFQPLIAWTQQLIGHEGTTHLDLSMLLQITLNTAVFVWLLWRVGEEVRNVEQEKEKAEKRHSIDAANQERLQKIIETQHEVAQLGQDKAGLMKAILCRTQALTGGAGAVIEMIEGEELCYVAATGTASQFFGLRLKIEGSFSGLCITSREVMSCVDSEMDPRVHRESCRKIGVRSMIVVPLVTNKKLIGVLKVYSEVPHAFSSTEINTMQLFAGLLGFSLASANDFEIKEAAIQALKASEKKLTLERERADRATVAKSEFLATLSHEIRTPLNGVIGTTELLRDTDLTTPQKEFIETIQTCSETLLFLINDILDFSKIEAKCLEIENINFSLFDVLEKVKRTQEFSAHRKGLALNVEFLSNPVSWFRGDPGRLRQILLNLISNAIKFTSQGSATVRVSELETSPEKTRFLFEVIDTGIGISVEGQTRLFQPFAQADASTTRQFGGTGLGLSISRSLVTLMGGEMGVRSEVGKGSVFWFSILLPHGQKPAVVPPEVLTSNSQVLKVLVVDDNVVNQELSQKMLKKLGHSSVLVGSGPEALQVLQNNVFDLILMDSQMPGIDGFETTRIIREREHSKGVTFHTPILALTANASQDDQKKCLSAGMNAFSSKPITLQKLQQGISSALRRVA